MQLTWYIVCFIVAMTMSFPLGNNTADDPGTNFYLIGTVNGKSFFAQREPLRTWFEARDFCHSMGMKFAKIETEAEANLLAVGPEDTEHFAGMHWVAGQDSHASNQVSWDDTNKTVDRFAFSWGVVTLGLEEYLTCFAYHSYYNSASHGDLLPCTNKEGVICEASES